MKNCISINDLKMNRYNGPLSSECMYFYECLQELLLNESSSLYHWSSDYAILTKNILSYKKNPSTAKNDQILSFLKKIATTMMYMRDIICDRNKAKNTPVSNNIGAGDFITKVGWECIYLVESVFPGKNTLVIRDHFGNLSDHCYDDEWLIAEFRSAS
ncbi:MAG: hypothetical protein COA52_00555 [Hyphomicrobiales bacterium]|nr:MAG: hypothetical protein COA52_00555 [Hyphomicrobiales bacterium]